MDDAAQAAAYDAGDFEEPHRAFVERFAARFPDFKARRSGHPGPGGDVADDGDVLDLGCGPADVTIRFARAHPGARVVGIDGSPAMLALARRRVAAEGLGDRVALREAFVPDPGLGRRRYAAVISNSLLHHLRDPADLWDTVRACTEPGGAVFVMDLSRPPDTATLERMVATCMAGEPEVLQRDFRNSLRAAYRPAEVKAQLAAAGLDSFTVEQASDRHLLVWGRAPQTGGG